jgi:DNA polymerase III delta prime subunit
MFKDFEERFSPKTIADIVYSDDEKKGLIEDLVSGARPFPVTASKCGILLYGLPGTGKSALATMLPDAIERARGGTDAYANIVRVQQGNNGTQMIKGLHQRANLMPWGLFNYFVLDEVDNLTDDAMAVLKSTMNTPKTLWVMTTNHIGKIDTAVCDRCHCIPFNAAPAERWRPLARSILQHARISNITDAQLDVIIKPFNGSARGITDAIVNFANQVHRRNAAKLAAQPTVV